MMRMKFKKAVFPKRNFGVHELCPECAKDGPNQDNECYIRVNDKSELQCESCGLIFTGFIPERVVTGGVDAADNQDYGKRHYEDKLKFMPLNKALATYKVRPFYLEGRLMEHQVIYVSPDNAAYFVTPGVDKRDWTKVPKWLHRELSKLGELPKYHGLKKPERKKRHSLSDDAIVRKALERITLEYYHGLMKLQDLRREAHWLNKQRRM